MQLQMAIDRCCQLQNFTILQWPYSLREREITLVIVHSGNTLNRAHVKNNGLLDCWAYLRLCGPQANIRERERLYYVCMYGKRANKKKSKELCALYVPTGPLNVTLFLSLFDEKKNKNHRKRAIKMTVTKAIDIIHLRYEQTIMCVMLVVH